MTPEECFENYADTGNPHYYALLPEDFRRAIGFPEEACVTRQITRNDCLESAECQALRISLDELDWYPY